MEDRIEEILRRLEALERRVDEMSRGRGAEREHHDVGECPFRSDERRIVDLIVDLMAARLDERLARMEGRGAPGPERDYGHHEHPHHHGPPHGHPHDHGPHCHPHGHGCPPGGPRRRW